MISRYCQECQQFHTVEKYSEPCPYCQYVIQMRNTRIGMIVVILVMLGILVAVSL